MTEGRVTIGDTTDTEIAYALADLAGFGEEFFVGRTNNLWHSDLHRKCVVVLHRETLERFDGSVVEAIGYKGPDIIVTQIYKRPEGGFAFEPTNEYHLDFNGRVDSSLVGRVEEEIRRDYAES